MFEHCFVAEDIPRLKLSTDQSADSWHSLLPKFSSANAEVNNEEDIEAFYGLFYQFDDDYTSPHTQLKSIFDTTERKNKYRLRKGRRLTSKGKQSPSNQKQGGFFFPSKEAINEALGDDFGALYY